MGPETWKGENMKRKLMVAISDVTLIFALALPSHLAAQEQEGEMAITSTENSVPLINQPLVPDATRPGGLSRGRIRQTASGVCKPSQRHHDGSIPMRSAP